ncbi:MAG: hypothetical protein KGL95_05705, partial [Patescibacteria group bacterium]|nr:hypothetical protein [Patescibacteria group bacterium]
MKKKIKRHSNMLFTDNDEEKLVAVILYRSRVKLPVTTSDIIRTMRGLHQLGQKWRGWCWYYGFLKRWQPYIRYGTANPIQAERMQTKTINDVDYFTKLMDRLCSRYSFQPQFVLNGDEARAGSPKFGMMKALLETCCAKGDTQCPSSSSLWTVLPIISAAGDTWCVLFIFKGREMDDGTVKLQNIPIDLNMPTRKSRFSNKFNLFYSVNKNGMMTEELWLSFIEKLKATLVPQLNGAECLFFVDNHFTHLSPEGIVSLWDSNIKLVFLPPKTTHWSQPLDNGGFAAAKGWIGPVLNKSYISALYHGEDTHELLPTIWKKSFDEVFTKKLLEHSFQETKLWPWKPNEFRARCEQQLIPTAPCKIESTTMSSISQLIDAIARVEDGKAVKRSPNQTKVGKVRKANFVYEPCQMVDEEMVLRAEAEKARQKRKREAQQEIENKRQKLEQRIAERKKKQEGRDAAKMAKEKERLT